MRLSTPGKSRIYPFAQDQVGKVFRNSGKEFRGLQDRREDAYLAVVIRGRLGVYDIGGDSPLHGVGVGHGGEWRLSNPRARGFQEDKPHLSANGLFVLKHGIEAAGNGPFPH